MINHIREAAWDPVHVILTVALFAALSIYAATIDACVCAVSFVLHSEALMVVVKGLLIGPGEKFRSEVVRCLWTRVPARHCAY